jgi:choline dehydrogenase-like flavoprotein
MEPRVPMPNRHRMVDADGRVLDMTKTSNTARDQRCYPGLYISDASIIPTALGVNPLSYDRTLAIRVMRTGIQEL